MKTSQGRRLIEALKRKPMTTMEMLQLGISVAPWKRIAESLQGTEQLIKYKRPGAKHSVYLISGKP